MNQEELAKNFEIDEAKELANLEKYTSFYFLMDFWMKLIDQKKRISAFFEERDYKKIAIYGNAAIGKHLKSQLENEGTKVEFMLNRNKIFIENQELDLENNIKMLDRVDVIVVTPIMQYKDIKKKLREFTKTNIVSIEEVILSL